MFVLPNMTLGLHARSQRFFYSIISIPKQISNFKFRHSFLVLNLVKNAINPYIQLNMIKPKSQSLLSI